MRGRASSTPLAAVGRGLVAGLAGTGVMTAYQVGVAKLRDSESSDVPAQVAKRVIEGVLQRSVPEERMGLLNNAMHVGYGTSWGALYGLARPSVAAGGLVSGLMFGAGVWAASLVQLPAMKLAPPVWESPLPEVGLDLSHHLVYGLGVAAAHRALEG